MVFVNNLMHDPVQRLARKSQKEKVVLHFLKQHIWSTQDILQQVMKLASRQSAHKSLVVLETQGYIKRHIYIALGGRITIWGITQQGQAAAFDLTSENIIAAYFEPSRVSEQTIRHQLDLQRLRLKAEATGWNHWIDGDRLGNYGKNQKRPDALANNPQGHIVALECERTFKSLKRYEQILVEYLKLIKAAQINCVVWVSPTEEMAIRLRKILTSISSVRINGQKVLIEPEKHHVHLHFCSYAKWPQIDG